MQTFKHIILAGNTAWSMYNFRRKLIQALVTNGYKVTIVSPHDEVFTPKFSELQCNYISVTINAKGTNPWQDLCLMRQYQKIFRQEKPDFIFFYTIKPNIYGSFVARFCKIPHIPVVTGLGYTFLNESLASKISKILYQFALKSANKVCFLNDDDRQTFINNKFVKSQKTLVLKGEGIDLSRFDIISLQKSSPISFLLIARMLWDKGVGEFIEAARIVKQKYPNTQFHLLGFLGVDNPAAISVEQINTWRMEGIIEYLGTTEDVVPFINAATCVVLPSYREGIPFTLLEASASGKPIITTNVIGCRDVIEDGITGYICEVRDPHSLADCMEKVIRLSSEQYAQMGLAGRKKMEREFDVNLIIDKYLNILDKILGYNEINNSLNHK